jgi:hypothetical protein
MVSCARPLSILRLFSFVGEYPAGLRVLGSSYHSLSLLLLLLGF